MLNRGQKNTSASGALEKMMLVLARTEGCDDLIDIGAIEISRNVHTGQVDIHVEGFAFATPQTCRSHAVKAMIWARDLLSAQIETERLVPGGSVATSRGIDQANLVARQRG